MKRKGEIKRNRAYQEKESKRFSLDGKTYEGPGAPVPGFDTLR